MTGQAPTLLAVDAGGVPSGPRSCGSTCGASGGGRSPRASEAERVGGNRLHAYYLGPKLEWMRRHAPGRFARPVTMLQSHSYPGASG